MLRKLRLRQNNDFLIKKKTCTYITYELAGAGPTLHIQFIYCEDGGPFSLADLQYSEIVVNLANGSHFTTVLFLVNICLKNFNSSFVFLCRSQNFKYTET